MRLFIFILFFYQTINSAKTQSLIISEMMIDPEPSVTLPNAEYIEIKNISNQNINVQNYTVTDFSNTAKLPNYILKAGEFLIVTSSTNKAKFVGLTNVVGVTNFPSLNNDIDTIVLYDNTNKILHFVHYDESLKNKNTIKYNGGWSLEMINFNMPFELLDNWGFSSSKNGGTPGAENSLVPTLNSNKTMPAIVNFSLNFVPQKYLHLEFNKPMDSMWFAHNKNIFHINDIGVKNVMVQRPIYKKILIEFETEMQEKNIYTLEIDSVKDLSNNVVNNLSVQFGVPSAVATNDVIINEILFNPLSDRYDFIEVYNRSNKVIDLQNLYFIRMNENLITDDLRMSSTPTYFFPFTYKVFTTEKENLLQNYPHASANDIIQASLPSMNDDADKIGIVDRNGLVIDVLEYSDKWHYPYLQNKEGVSLEKIDFNLPTQNQNSWHSAAYPWFATPTLQNSQFRNFESINNSFTLNTDLITPNNDGLNDFLDIRYEVVEANILMSIKIFSLHGDLIRNLLNSTLIIGKGSVQWDGLGEGYVSLPTGNYILFFELINSTNGTTQTTKKMISISQ